MLALRTKLRAYSLTLLSLANRISIGLLVKKDCAIRLCVNVPEQVDIMDDSDLLCETKVYMFGRYVVMLSCDAFTRLFYSLKYNRRKCYAFPPVSLSRSFLKSLGESVPPDTIYGVAQ